MQKFNFMLEEIYYKLVVKIMSIITVEIPENVPVDIIKKKIQKVIKEESLKWRLFEGAKKELDLSEDDFKDFEEAREEAWKEIRKKYGL